MQDLHGYDSPWPAGGGKQLYNSATFSTVKLGTITCTNNGDGSFTFNADEADTVDRFFDIFNNQFSENQGGTPLPSAQYRLTGTPSGGSPNTYTMYTRPAYSYDAGDGATFTNSVIGGSIFIKAGYRPQNLVFRPMIRLASNGDDAFAPYSNECPISGWTGANVTRTGKNLLDLSSVRGGNYDTEISFPSNSATTNDYIPVKGGASYVWSQKRYPLKGGRYLRWYDEDYVQIGSDVNIYSQVAYTLTAPLNACYAKFHWYQPSPVWQSKDDILADEPMFELGSTATPYVPYSGNQYTIQLGQTVYGATLDVTAGKMVVSHVIVKLGNWMKGLISNYSSKNGYYYNGAFLTPPMASGSFYSDPDTICSHFAKKSNADSGMGMWIGANSTYFYFAHVIENIPNIETSAKFCEWLEANDVFMTYPLATPIEIPLTATEITTLLGTNNLWTNTGEIKTLNVSTKGKNVFALAPPKT